MIDLSKLDPSEAERIAYAEGFTGVAALYSRIDDLSHAATVLLNQLDLHDFNDLDLSAAIDDLREAIK